MNIFIEEKDALTNLKGPIDFVLLIQKCLAHNDGQQWVKSQFKFVKQ